MRIVWTAQGNKRLEHIFACCSDFYSQKQLRELNKRLKSAEQLLADIWDTRQSDTVHLSGIK